MPAVAALRASLERWAALDGRPKVLGFDVEWRVTFERGVGARPVATLQLSSYDVCAVFHVIHYENEPGTACPASLAALLTDPTIGLTGCCAGNDAIRLAKDTELSARELQDKVVELSEMARCKLDPLVLGGSSSLQTLCDVVLGRHLGKPPHLRLGNWEQRPLPNDAVVYAALDAYAGFRVFEELSKLPDRPLPVSRLASSTNACAAAAIAIAASSDAMPLPARRMPAWPAEELGPLQPTKRQTYEQFHILALTAEEISVNRALKLTTVMGYLTSAIDAGYEYDFSRWGIPSNVEYHALCAWRLAHEAAAGAGRGGEAEAEGGGEDRGVPSNPKPPGMRDVKELLPPVVLAEFWQLSACLAHFKRVYGGAGCEPRGPPN